MTLKDYLETCGFSFHNDDKGWFWCWCGPLNLCDVECSGNLLFEETAVQEAADRVRRHLQDLQKAADSVGLIV